MPLNLYGETFEERLLLGTARYPSPKSLKDAIEQSNCPIVTVSLRRESSKDKTGQQFWEFIKDRKVKVLPNTAGCGSVKEAINTAQMAREVFQTNWIKLEIIGEHDTLQPDVFALVEAAKILARDGFKIFPYTTEDLIVAEKLIACGCEILMPWGAPIGSGKGLNNVYGLRALRAHFPQTTLVIDAGIGAPSHATQAMEMGYDAILLNTAVAKAANPPLMAQAFSQAIKAGREAYKAGLMEPLDMAVPSTPVLGKPF